MDVEVFSLHPHWCHESTRDEKRMQEAIEVDSECIARLHYVNFLSGRFSFPLLSAVAMGHVRCSRMLAEAEVALERRDFKGVPAIARALVHGKQAHAAQTVALLLECGARPNYTGTQGARSSFLDLSVRFMLPKAMIALLEAGAETEDWTYVRSNPGPSCTPLLQACTLTDTEPLRILLTYGADINPHRQLRNLMSPAHVVIKSCLKRHGDKQDCSGELMILLYKNGSDIWGHNYKDVRTPIECASTLPLLYSVIKDLIHSPATLQQLSRACVRRFVHPRCIYTLPLPDSIKLYLQE